MSTKLHKKSMNTASCPIAKVSHIIADTCTVLILRDLLRNDTARFTEFLRKAEEIGEKASTRTLTIKLKKLVDSGLISSTDAGYSITKKGRKFEALIEEMYSLGESLR